jgi:hypothetical protein
MRRQIESALVTKRARAPEPGVAMLVLALVAVPGLVDDEEVVDPPPHPPISREIATRAQPHERPRAAMLRMAVNLRAR